MTIGLEFGSKEVKIDNNVSLTLQIWDTVNIYLYCLGRSRGF